MQQMAKAAAVPAARTIDLVTTESKDEVLVYDQAVHHIHHLNASAAKVWRLCDGQRSVSDIAVESGLTEDAVMLALRTLENAQLLDSPLTTPMRGTQSRRTFLKKAAIGGALSVPAIVSISAPAAAMNGSDSTCGRTCTNSGDCTGLGIGHTICTVCSEQNTGREGTCIDPNP